MIILAKTGFTRNLSKEQLEDIIEMYTNKISAKVIAEKYHTSRPTIISVLKRNGVKINENGDLQRKYNVNEHYFDEIDTPNKAYILGFLYADGTNFTPRNLIRLGLKDDDIGILELIKKEMEVEKELKYRNNWKSVHQLVSLEFQSKYMSEKLEELGCPNNKSLILKFPAFISDELMPHFLRGYFDGDGYIQDPEKRRNCTMIIIVSSKFFIDDLKVFLKDKLEIESKIRVMPNPATESLYITKTEYVKRFCDYIYKDADLYLERKYLRYLNKFYPELYNEYKK